jgi:Leucine-rich repeat (LRR) protein
MIISNQEILLLNTDCQSLDQIRVIYLRNQGIAQAFKMLAKCENLTVLYMQQNLVMATDLLHLQTMSKLRRLDLSSNKLETLPSAKVFA